MIRILLIILIIIIIQKCFKNKIEKFESKLKNGLCIKDDRGNWKICKFEPKCENYKYCIDFKDPNIDNFGKFMVRENSGIRFSHELRNFYICAESKDEIYIKNYFKKRNIKINDLLLFKKNDEAIKNFINGRCDAYFISTLNKIDLNRYFEPEKYIILPEYIEK